MAFNSKSLPKLKGQYILTHSEFPEMTYVFNSLEDATEELLFRMENTSLEYVDGWTILSPFDYADGGI